jgi:hypothetical protein
MALWFNQPLTECVAAIFREGGSGVKLGRCVRLTTSQPSLSLLSRKCGILDALQSYRRPQSSSRFTFILRCVSHVVWIEFLNIIKMNH